MDYRLLKFVFIYVIGTFTLMTYSQVTRNQPVMQEKVYKIIGRTKLKLYIYQPAERNDLEQL
jgi:hypothetical protein